MQSDAAHRTEQLDLDVAAAREPDLDRAGGPPAAEVVFDIGSRATSRSHCNPTWHASPPARRRSPRRQRPAGTGRRRRGEQGVDGRVDGFGVGHGAHGSRTPGRAKTEREPAGTDAHTLRTRRCDRGHRHRGGFVGLGRARDLGPDRPVVATGDRRPTRRETREQSLALRSERTDRDTRLPHHQHGHVGLDRDDHEHHARPEPASPSPVTEFGGQLRDRLAVGGTRVARRHSRADRGTHRADALPVGLEPELQHRRSASERRGALLRHAHNAVAEVISDRAKNVALVTVRCITSGRSAGGDA